MLKLGNNDHVDCNCNCDHDCDCDRDHDRDGLLSVSIISMSTRSSYAVSFTIVFLLLLGTALSSIPSIYDFIREKIETNKECMLLCAATTTTATMTMAWTTANTATSLIFKIANVGTTSFKITVLLLLVE